MDLTITPVKIQSNSHLSKPKKENNTGAHSAVGNLKTEQLAYPKNYYLAKKQVSFKGTAYDLSWARTWDREARKKELDTQAEKDIASLSIWRKKFTSSKKDIKNRYASKLEEEQIRVNTLLQNSATLQTKIDAANTQAGQNAAKEKDLEIREAEVKKLKSARDIMVGFAENRKGGLDEQIAGYEAEKNLLRDEFISRIALEKNGEKVDIPKGVLFYGTIGTGKNTFSRAVAAETDCVPVVINPTSEQFSKKVQEELMEAKKRYIDENKRTIIIVNEIEKHLADTSENGKNIGLIKDVLDDCSLPPVKGIENSCATTFFFTTNHPMDITDEILLRRGKLGLLIPLEPADTENIKAVLKHYVTKGKYDFDPEEDVDYDKCAAILKPDMEKGAYSNDKLSRIVESTYKRYDNDRSLSFNEHLLERCQSTKRDIRPSRLEQYYKDLEELYED